MNPEPHDDDNPLPAGVEAHEWQRAEASLELARATQQPLRLCEALAEVARCERRSGWPELAALSLDDALRYARTLGGVDLLADLLCERGDIAADIALQPGTPVTGADLDAWLQARACAAEAATLAAQTSDPAWEVKLLLRASDLFNRLGSAVEAAALQVRAMQRLGQGRLQMAAERAPAAPVPSHAHPTLQ